MSTPDTSNSKPVSAQATDDKSTGKFSPFAGCSIFIIAGLIAVGMVTFLVWSYFQTRDMIESFTDENAQIIQVADSSAHEAAQVALHEKLVGFRHNIEVKNKDEITLNAEEMNLAIATFGILKPHQGKLHINAIQADHIQAQIAFPTKSRMRSDENRYINATLTIQPEIVDGAAFPKIITVTTNNGGEIPEQFKQFISETLLKPLYDDKELGPIFQSLSAVEIKDNTLILRTDPKYQPENNSPQENSDLAIDRLLKGFAIIAVVFLAIVTLIIIISRRKAKQP
jgi:hypothetical protein